MGGQRNKAFVVLGPGRSGTSTIASALVALGADFGNQLKPKDPHWNPKGFYEDQEICYQINRQVLRALDYNWSSRPQQDDFVSHQDKLQCLTEKAVALLKRRFSSSTHWGFKDPTTAKVLPFWRPVFAALEVDAHYIIAARSPLATAFSFQRVEGADIELGLLRWLMHLVSAIEGSEKAQRTVVSYEGLLQRPRAELARLQSVLALPPVQPQCIDRYVEQFLDSGLQHYQFNVDALSTSPAVAVAPTCKALYLLLTQLAQDEISFDGDDFRSAWQNILEDIDTFCPIYRYVDRLLKRNKALERELRTVRKSLPWKMVFPLRAFDGWLRARRKRARTQI